jgi:hypothetical protein
MQRNAFECGHKGFGKYCHFCKDIKAGRPVGKKAPRPASAGGRPAEPQEPRYWQRARCPHCNGNRVKKNDLNVLSALDAFEYTCMDFNCGKSFNSDQVKEFDKIEVKGPPPRR